MLMRPNQVNNFIPENRETRTYGPECVNEIQNIVHDTHPRTNKPTISSRLVNKHECFVILIIIKQMYTKFRVTQNDTMRNNNNNVNTFSRITVMLVTIDGKLPLTRHQFTTNTYNTVTQMENYFRKSSHLSFAIRKT